MLLGFIVLVYVLGIVVFLSEIENPALDWIDDNSWSVVVWPIVVVCMGANIVYQYFYNKYSAYTEQNRLLIKIGLLSGLLGGIISNIIKTLVG